MAAPAGLQIVVTDLQSEKMLTEVLARADKAQVVELYAEWAGPTQACKSAWRKLALEHGGALPVDLSSACLERLGGAAALAPHTQHPSSEPSFLVFRGGREVACVRGLNIPALLAAVARAQGGAATVQRQSSTQ